MSRRAPRIYGILATRAPIAAIFRRGPSAWAHVGRWDLEAGRYESGAWLHARVFPRRSDLSPDGRLLTTLVHDPSSTWEHGDVWIQLSRLPWMTALHAFATGGTWSRGYHFTAGQPAASEDGRALPMPWGLEPTPVVQFATERRRGWRETADSPARDPSDAWDQRRNVRLERLIPGRGRLVVESIGRPGGEFERQATDGLRVRYRLEVDGRIESLDDLQWADVDGSERLVCATRDGRLQVRELDGPRGRVVEEHDLRSPRPDPVPSPEWARRW